MVDNTETNDKSLIYKIAIIILLTVFLTLLIILVIRNNNEVYREKKIGGTRTIMIYASPTNLEDDVYSFTTDLAGIDSEKIDLENMNILLYTGGTKEWHNFIKNDENAIYVLKEDGFEKLETLKQDNMSNPETLSYFLNYAYENYKTDQYDLIIYDHGNALQGAVLDEFYPNDIITLKEFDTALKKSPFNENNKLELVLFRACLMGTVEVAGTFSSYADYLVASEEVVWLGRYKSVFGFLNDVKTTTTPVEIGQMYIDDYKEFMEGIDPYNERKYCYSIIDLKEIDNLFKQISLFAKKVKLKDNYSSIAKVRSQLYQFALDSGINYIDTIDLYDFIKKIDTTSSYDAKKVLDSINKTVVYNFSTIDDIMGLAIYFPYNGNSDYVKLFLNIYKDFKYGTDYLTFMDAFYDIKENGSSTALTAASVANIDLNINKNEFSLKLNEEELADFSKADYLVLRKMNDDYYMPVYISDDPTLSEDGTLTTNITNKIIRIKDDTVDDAYLQVFHSANNKDQYTTNGVIDNFADGNFIMKNAIYTIRDVNGIPEITNILSKSDEYPEGIILNKEDFTVYEFMTFWYKMFDENNNYTSDWQSNSTYYGYNEHIDNLELEFTSLKDTGDYYCLFRLYDIYGNMTVSNLIKLDN